MKGLKGLASVIVLLGLTVCTSHANAEIELQQDKSPVESQINPDQSISDSQNTKSKLEQGFNLFKAEDYSEAIKAFSEVIEVEAGNQYAYLGRGISYLILNDYQKAKVDLDESISLDDNISHAYLFRGLTNYALGNKQEAVSDLREAANLFEKEEEKEMLQKTLDLIKNIRNEQ